jgi:hypothetical protein
MNCPTAFLLSPGLFRRTTGSFRVFNPAPNGIKEESGHTARGGPARGHSIAIETASSLTHYMTSGNIPDMSCIEGCGSYAGEPLFTSALCLSSSFSLLFLETLASLTELLLWS